MASKLFSLDNQDWIKGGVVVVLGAVLASLQQMLTQHGLDFSAWDFGWILNCAIIAGMAYLTKNFTSDSEGKVMGKIG